MAGHAVCQLLIDSYRKFLPYSYRERYTRIKVYLLPKPLVCERVVIKILKIIVYSFRLDRFHVFDLPGVQ